MKSKKLSENVIQNTEEDSNNDDDEVSVGNEDEDSVNEQRSYNNSINIVDKKDKAPVQKLYDDDFTKAMFGGAVSITVNEMNL